MIRGPDAFLYLCVAAGSGIGSVARHAVAVLLPPAATGGWPLATFAVNVGGSCLLGFFAAMTGPDGPWLVRPALRQGVMIGFCGGLTTFSAFSLEGVLLLHVHEVLETCGYVLLSLTGWLAAAWLGHAAAFRLIRPGD
jgi:CrcB protein